MDSATITFDEALGRHGIGLPDVDLSGVEVPMLTGVQRQGDVLIVPAGPAPPVLPDGCPTVPKQGVRVVRGEATGNTHMLDALEGPVGWQPGSDDPLCYGTVTVPEGAAALLVHTDEHGANGIGPGVYRLVGKREQADEMRRVVD